MASGPPTAPRPRPEGRTPLDEELAARVRRHGPLSFAEVMSAALYDPDEGFYATGGGAGRHGGDFITSPEVGPLFGAVVARALDRWWHELGEPDPFVVIEAAAATGTLARTVRAAVPECGRALTYVLVETSPVLRARQGEHLPLTDPLLALPPSAGDRPTPRGRGPRFVPLAELPVGPFTGVVLANELLDNLPVTLLERRDGAWHEVRVGLADDDLTLVEQLVPAEPLRAERAEDLVPDAPDGARVPLATVAAAWLRQARARLERGRLLIVDYGDTTASLAARPPTEWLRTYRAHERGGVPLAQLGRQDITCEVPVDQLERLAGPLHRERQADFLRRFGIDELVAEGRRVWHERAQIGDLEAVRARSRVHEAEALLDPGGLGAFWVLTAEIGP